MINYNIIQKSIVHYETNGFKRIELPWTVSEYVDNITKPHGTTSFQLKHNDKCLVASGEQSFLYLYLKGFLPPGTFQGVTPCYRYESFDYLHTKYFIKNELIKTDVVNKEELNKIVKIACAFFRPFFQESLNVRVTDDGFDIEINGDELGSYGIRKCDFLEWIYGTACAEPRLSNLITKHNK